MTGRGTNGLTVRDALVAQQKCPDAPGKRKFHSLVEAEKAAAFSSREYHKTIVPYACAGCGLWHVTGKVRGSDVARSRGDGMIKTAAMVQRESLATIPRPVERIDMSTVVAAETPIVPGNHDATVKLLREFLAGRESTSVSEVMEALSITKTPAQNALKELGWTGHRGRPEWYPADKDPANQISAAKLRANQQRNLRRWLNGKDAVTTPDVMTYLGCGRDQAKRAMKEAGWYAGWGAGARWTPTPQETPKRRENTVKDPIQLDTRRAMHPAIRNDDDVAVVPEAPTEDGWRTLPTTDQLAGMTLEQMLVTLAPFGMEVRLQIRGIQP